jgi:hypothetical protein
MDSVDRVLAQDGLAVSAVEDARSRDDSTARVVDWHPERESSRIHLAVSFGKKYLCACR